VRWWLVDVAHPIRIVTPTLDGPVLEVLARTTRPLTGSEIHRIAGVGSPNGIRLALARLADQGVVIAEERARAVFHVANRDHLGWPAIESLANVRHALFERLGGEIQSWDPQPLHASVFGSAARGDGDTRSDIDLLVIRPDGLDEDESPWAEQVDRLRERIYRWTGNDGQVFQLDRSRLAEYVRAGDPLVGASLRDAVELAGPPLSVHIRTLPPAREA
jgi:predicted nucleotidyltransferase